MCGGRNYYAGLRVAGYLLVSSHSGDWRRAPQVLKRSLNVARVAYGAADGSMVPFANPRRLPQRNRKHRSMPQQRGRPRPASKPERWDDWHHRRWPGGNTPEVKIVRLEEDVMLGGGVYHDTGALSG